MIKGIISRRASQRIPFQAEITIQFYVENSEPVIAQTTNISLEGLRFFVPKGLIKLAPEDSIELVFNIGNSQIEVKGEVCYFANAFDNEHRPVVYYGIKFTELTDETWKIINDYCTAKLAASDSPSEVVTAVQSKQEQSEKVTELTASIDTTDTNNSIDSINFGLPESNPVGDEQLNSGELLIDSVFELQPEDNQELTVSNTEPLHQFTDVQIDSIFDLQQSDNADSNVSLTNTITNSSDIQIDSIFELEQSTTAEPNSPTVEHVIPFEFLSSSLNPVDDAKNPTPEPVLPDPVPGEPLISSISPNIEPNQEPAPESVLPDPVPLEPFINPVETSSTSESKAEPVIDVGNPFRSLSQEIIDKLIDSMSSNQKNSKAPENENTVIDNIQPEENSADIINNINNNNSEITNTVSDEPTKDIQTETVSPIEETKEEIVTSEPLNEIPSDFSVNNEITQESVSIDFESNLNNLGIDQSDLDSLLEQSVTEQVVSDEYPEVSQSEINSLYETNDISPIETASNEPATSTTFESNQPVESKVEKVDPVEEIKKVEPVEEVKKVEPVKEVKKVEIVRPIEEPVPISSPPPDIVIDHSKIPNLARGSSTVPMDQKMIDQLIERLVPKNKPAQPAPVTTSNEPETFTVKLETLNGEIINCKIVRLYFGGIIIESPKQILENSPYKISISSNTTEINNITGICSMCEQLDPNNYKAEFFFKGLSNSNMDMEILKSLIVKLQNNNK